jgi:hypothetical protein
MFATQKLTPFHCIFQRKKLPAAFLLEVEHRFEFKTVFLGWGGGV